MQQWPMMWPMSGCWGGKLAQCSSTISSTSLLRPSRWVAPCCRKHNNYFKKIREFNLSIVKIIMCIHVYSIFWIPRHSCVCFLGQVMYETNKKRIFSLNQSKGILRILVNIQKFIYIIDQLNMTQKLISINNCSFDQWQLQQT